MFLTSKVGGDVNSGSAYLQVIFSPRPLFFRDGAIFRLQKLLQYPVSVGAAGGARPLDDLVSDLFQHLFTEHRGAKATIITTGHAGGMHRPPYVKEAVTAQR